MTIEQAEAKMEEFSVLVNRRYLSDEYLISDHSRNRTTRADIGIGGEYLYGIVMMPDDLVFEIVNAFRAERDMLKAKLQFAVSDLSNSYGRGCDNCQHSVGNSLSRSHDESNTKCQPLAQGEINAEHDCPNWHWRGWE